jgi:hypothetical protein
LGELETNRQGDREARDAGRNARFPLRSACVLVLFGGAAGCAPSIPAAAAPEPQPPGRAPGGEPAVLRGYLGRAPIDAALVADAAGFHGCYRTLGTSSAALVTGTRGGALNADPGDAGERDEPREFECRFEARSDLARLGSIVARCVAFPDDPPAPPNWEVRGVFFNAKGGDGTPFYLGPTTYPGVPDALLLALARADPAPHACAPFIDVLDVRTLPGDRRAVLYAQSFPCEAPIPAAGEAPPPPAPGRLRLALFPAMDPTRPHVVAVPGEDDGEPAALAVYALTPGVEIFLIERQSETSPAASGHTFVDERRTLFAFTRGGRAGPPLELPEVENDESGCGTIDSVKLRRAELDGEGPPELVVELARESKPCDENAAADEPNETTDAAYGFDAELGRFTPLEVSSPEIRRQKLTYLEDVSRPDETWRERQMDDTCSPLPP